MHWPKTSYDDLATKNQLFLFTLVAVPAIGFAADLSGTWKSEFDSQIGRQKYTYPLKQQGDKLTGKANSEINDQKHETPLSEGKVDGDKVSFILKRDGAEQPAVAPGQRRDRERVSPA